MEHKTLVDAVVTAEWEMFSNVQNVGGKASCQMDPKTFRIMRSSQMDNWDDELLGSYLEDLLNARLEGRNLVTEKYARMMESTFPEEYAQLADSLPPLDPEAARLDDIVAAHVSWKEDLDSRFPSLADRGRPLRSRDDRPGWVSMETYLRAELRTYSPKTIALYHRATMERLRKGESEAEQNLLHQVQQYGFEDIRERGKAFQRPSLRPSTAPDVAPPGAVAMMRFRQGTAALEKAATSKPRRDRLRPPPWGWASARANLLDLPGLAMRAENQKSHPYGWLF